MKLRPLRDHIVVEVAKQEEVVVHGIILPDAGKNLPKRATVIRVGPGDRDDNGTLIPMDVKEGDVVMIDSYSGDDFMMDDKQVKIICRHNVIAVIED